MPGRLRTAFEAAGGILVVGEAPDAASALVTVRRRLPDVLMLDLRLRGGLDTLRALPGLRRRPAAIVLTAFGADPAILRALREGAAGFLLHSARPTEVAKVLRLAADGHVVLSAEAAHRLAVEATRLTGPRDERLVRVDRLSARETDILAGIGEALTNAEIAARLDVPEPVVAALVRAILRKLGCTTRTEAGLLAYERGLCRVEFSRIR